MSKIRLPKHMPRTVQAELLADLTEKLHKRTDIHGLISRGSFSKGLSDKYSDVDLVLVFSNSVYKENIVKISDLISEYVNVITKPGWYDTNVPDFGGMGYVLLVNYLDTIVQLDIYSLPIGNTDKINCLSDKVVMYQENVSDEKIDVTPMLEELKQKFSNRDQLILDVLLHFFMLSKYLARRDVFLAAKYWHLLQSKILMSIRYALEPNTYDYMFYDVHRHLDKYKTIYIEEMERLLAADTSVLNRDQLIKFYEFFENIARQYFSKEYYQRVNIFKTIESVISNEAH